MDMSTTQLLYLLILNSNSQTPDVCDDSQTPDVICIYINNRFLTALERSLINTIKSKGPRTDPCGTPLVIVLGIDRAIRYRRLKLLSQSLLIGGYFADIRFGENSLSIE